MNTYNRGLMAVVAVCMLSAVGAPADAMGTGSAAGYRDQRGPEADPALVARQTSPSGVPCGGLAARLSLQPSSSEALSERPTVDVELVNVAAEPITVDVGFPGELLPVLLLFDATGRALYPVDLQLLFSGYEGSGAPRPVQLQPGEAANAWRGVSLYTPCKDLGLAPGSYTAQVLLFMIPGLEEQRVQRILLSNPLPFQWQRPAE
ncbi:MAG: hypothetical protein KBI47_17885 [Armatimonadetes bacterium]|jgi:hypothetical protein|nr:hypothetical protein [Armatimonadota bacterium]MDI9583912.1 hypothetical protein [Acidobacteriota bacterium]